MASNLDSIIKFLNEQINAINSNRHIDSNFNGELIIRRYQELIAFSTIYADKINQIYFDTNLLYDKNDKNLNDDFFEQLEVNSYFKFEVIKIRATLSKAEDENYDDIEYNVDENEDDSSDDDEDLIQISIVLPSKYLLNQPAIIKIDSSYIGVYKTKELHHLLSIYCNEYIGSEILCKIFIDIPKFVHILKNVSLEHCLYEISKITNTSRDFNLGQLTFLDKLCNLDFITLKNSKTKINLALNVEEHEKNDGTQFLNLAEYTSETSNLKLNFFNKKIKNSVKFDFESVKTFCTIYTFDARSLKENFSSYRATVFDFDFSEVENKLYDNFVNIIYQLQAYLMESFLPKYNDSSPALQKIMPKYICIDSVKQKKHFLLIVIQESVENYFSLKQYQSLITLTKKPITFNKTTLSIINNVLNCLKYLEVLKYFHGNIDLNNIFIDSNGNTKLFDIYIEPFLLIIAPFLMEQFIAKSDYIINNSIELFNHNCYIELRSLMLNTDVFNFGSLIITFLIDLDFNPFLTYFTSEQLQLNAMLKIFNKLSNYKYNINLKKTLNYCFLIRKQKKLDNLPFNQFKSELEKIFETKNNLNLFENIVEIAPQKNINSSETNSRIFNDFQIIKRLGRGN